MNWGHKIALVYAGFVVFMLALVFACINQKDIFLVSDDYYADEIAYEATIQKKRNTNQLGQATTIEFNEKTHSIDINLSELSNTARGEVTIYRPSNAKMDVKVPLQLNNEGKQSIATNELPKGLWVVKIDWKNASKDYYKETKIQVY